MLKNVLENNFKIQFEMLLNVIPSSVLMINRQLQVLWVNENFLLKSQRSKENIVGRFLAEVFPLVILQSTGIEESIFNVFQSGVPLKGQKMTYRAPGIPFRIYYYSILPISSEQIMLVMEDVTEQFRLSEEVRRIERQLALVVESASDIVLSTDIDGHILTWNSAAEKLSALSTQDVLGRYFYDLCDPYQTQEVRQILQRMKTSNATHTTEFNLINHSDNGKILISWVFSPMKDDFSKTVGTVVVGRDLAEPILVADIRNVVEGDASPDGKGTLSLCRGIEVGHIFQLRTKYSEAMNATYLDENGQTQVMEMGCYGIGVSRIVGAAIEQGNDERGIIFPASMAPFSVTICPIGYDKSEVVRLAANTLYDELVAAGVDVMLDDRGERPGVMFAEADLMGLPHRLVVGERGLADGMVEYKTRANTEAQSLPLINVVEYIQKATL